MFLVTTGIHHVMIMLAFLPTLLLEGKLKFKSFACAQQNSMGSRKFGRRVLVEHYCQRKALYIIGTNGSYQN